MHILFVPHVIEMLSATIIMLALLLWPVYTCREVTDSEFENAYVRDEKCALELHVCFFFSFLVRDSIFYFSTICYRK